MKKLYSAKINYSKSILQIVLIIVLALSPTIVSFGQVRVDFTPRSSVFTPNKTVYNVKGDFTMLGNTNLTLVNYTDNGNNSSAMTYVDIDNDPNTFNSSAATLTFSDEFGANPECSNVVYAGLYWTGRSRAENSFTITKDVATGNTITQQVTNNETIYDGDAIPNTNYTLTRSVSGSLTTFTFTSSGSGDTVEFFYNTGFSSASRYLRVSVNGGPQTNVATSSLNNSNAYLDVPYTVFSSPDYTLTVNRLRLSNSARAYVEVTYNQTIPEIIQLTKTLDKRKVSIKGPNASTYTQLTANANDIYYPSGTDGDMFSAYVDVTDYVRNNGNAGLYHVADIALVEGDGGSTGYYGGWGMVVVYENSQMKWKDITVFDGHAYVAGNTTVSHTLDVAGFNSAQNGPVNLKLGVMAGEGDRNISGDYFKMRKHSDNTFESLNHSGNSTTNFFNSSILTDGARFPDLLNNTGLDISIFDLDNSNNSLIGNNQTSTRFEYGSTQDTYIIFNITFAVDAYIPESEGLLSLQSIAGNPANAPYIAFPGDQLEYGLEIRNKGTEPIKDAKLVIPIPFTSEFVPGSINFNEYDNLFNATAPYFDPNEGATGAIVWDISYLPLDTDLTKLLADIRFRLKTTEDCSILVNNNCAPKIVIVGGYIAGTGVTSNVQYSLPLIQGYQENGICEGEPNTDPIEVDIDSEQYIIDNCTGVSVEREFLYCNFDSSGIPVSEIQAQFPQGSLFYDSYPVTDNSIQYNVSNPFPATIGKTTYYAVPPGSSACSYIFTIEVTEITSSPSVSNVDYCLNETADPLTAQVSNPDYSLFYYADNNPNTVGQTSLIPDTSIAGVFTYYVAEGPAANCVNATRTPITVTVYEGLTITLEEQINNSCANSNNGSIDISVSGGSGNYTFDWDHNGLQDPDSDTEDLTNLPDGTYTVVVSDTDTNCTATASFVIITENTGSVEITAPTALTVSGCTTDDITNGNLTSLVYSETLVTISTAEFLAEGGSFNGDNIANVTYIDSSTGECPIVVTRTFSVTDACAQTASSTQIITIENDVAPILVAPQDETIECGDSTDPSVTGTATVSAACGAVEITYEDAITPGTCEGEYSITRTWIATDTCGNISTVAQTINVQDTTAPVIAALPADSTIDCSVTPEFAQATATDACSSDVTLTFEDVTSPGACDSEYSITRTWTATDACGNASTASQTINVQDTTAPVIAALPADSTIDCSVTPEFAQATATDACGSDVTLTFEDVTTPGACEGEYSITRTWTATDACGNASTASQTINVQDTTAPVIAALPADSTIDCSVTPEFAQATATDGCGSEVTLTFEDVTTPGACEGEYSITRTWTATDACGNASTASQTINMVDNVAPVLSVPADATVECSESTEPSATGMATATDSCGEVTITHVDTAEEGCGNTQTITRTWTATDECGNTTSNTQIITVVDTTPPVLTVPADVTLECTGLSRMYGEATATDACGNVIITFEDSAVEGCGVTQVISRTWTATDECGNSVSEIQTISIVDTTAPTITIPADITVECSESKDPLATGSATGEDMCGSVQVTFDDVVTDGDCEGEYSINRTWTVTDECGNTTTGTQMISVVDTTSPIIDNPASDIVVDCDDSGSNSALEAWLNSNGGATASDACSTSLTWKNNYNGATSDCSSPIEVIFTVSDGCGNSTSTSATYAIQDVIAPEITTPAADLTVECDGLGNMTDLQTWLEGNAGATAFDKCSAVTWSNDFDGLSDECGATGSATVTFTATDGCGNSSSTTAKFTIVDTTAPVIDPLPAVTTIDCSVAVEFTQATATDLCSGDDMTFTFEDVTTPGTCEGEYSITRTWTVKDACGNASTASQTINVQDITAPVIAELPAETTIDCSVTPEFTQAVATDACGSEVTLTFEDVKTPGDCEGDYSITRTWTATDACGNASTATQTINVKDVTAPVIANLPADSTVDCTVTPEFAQATATDACGSDVVLTFEDVTTPGDCEGDYSITRTWTATDACGNASTASQTIHVRDMTAPNLVTEYQSEISITCDNIPAVPELVFEDACSNDIQVAFNETSTATEGSLQYIITRTWTVSDTCDNEAVYTQTINVDNTVDIIVATGTELCNGDDLNFDLFSLLSGSYDTNGTWSVVAGTASVNGSIFNPYGLELGTYTFMYSVADEYCPTETLVNITLNDDCVVLPCGAEDVVISKAVTTYADGKNDFFTITGVEDCGFTIELQIFNRWGAMIYESNNYQNDWNGSSSKASIGSSNYVPTGTYYYVVNLKNSGLKPFAGPIYVATK
ncbi:gliding motility-associated C-terminal domain-containing protein [Gelidibacter japonicus]|uniref:HYR-like domain-containing protein n=1 Tax=Gelidibacter japonicus TaxID=1962232 RepID=UPI002AFE0B5B|nr:gliding motility-associated C-terminal domain-containing protein [Gelidibacter japonicus]